jgi:hypothetical protein
MSRFFVAVIIGSAIAAAASTSASAWHCLASSPNGAAGTAFGGRWGWLPNRILPPVLG